MKFKATDNLNVRAAPDSKSPKVGALSAGSIVESDEHAWKAITLADGTRGYCAATYLVALDEPLSPKAAKWAAPIRSDKFKLTQTFLNPDPDTYKITEVHPGVDYGTKGEEDVPLFFCADGEVIEVGANHKSFGNFFFYYVPEVDRTFAYFHLRDAVPSRGPHKTGEQCGIAGKTGLSKGIHLHLECLKGRKTSSDRGALYTSRSGVVGAAECADTFIRSRLK